MLTDFITEIPTEIRHHRRLPSDLAYLHTLSHRKQICNVRSASGGVKSSVPVILGQEACGSRVRDSPASSDSYPTIRLYVHGRRG